MDTSILVEGTMNKKIKFTPNAKIMYSEFLKLYEDYLQFEINEMLKIPGEHEIAVDEYRLAEVFDSIDSGRQLYKKTKMKSRVRKLSLLYFIIGIISAIIAFIYPTLIQLLDEEPIRFQLLAFSMVVILVSFIGLFSTVRSYKTKSRLREYSINLNNRLLGKQNKMHKYFNCSEEHEVRYLAGKFNESTNEVISAIRQLCLAKVIHYSTHEEAERSLELMGFTKKSVGSVKDKELIEEYIRKIEHIINK